MANDELSLFEEDNLKRTNQDISLTGTIAAIFFESPDSFFKVLLIDVEDNDFNWNEAQIVVTGDFADLQEGEKYTFTGRIVAHPKYGQQIQSKSYRRSRPNTSEGLIAYLSGTTFKGIGKQTATKIVDELGLTAIQKIMADASILRKVGLSKKQIDTIVAGLNENAGNENILIGLSSYGFGTQLSAKIYHKYREDTLKVIEEDPYQLVKDIENIGFKRADQIARKMGIQFDNPKRISAAIISTVSDWCNNTGDTYITTEQLLTETTKLLTERDQTIEPGQIAEEVISLAKEGMIFGQENRVYLRWLFQAEQRIGSKVNQLLNGKVKKLTDSYLNKIIEKVEKLLSVQYDQTQKKALGLALKNPISIITGGPGTGKTTIIKGLINIYAEINDLSLDINEYTDTKFPILLTAPTGRAAQRLNEATEIPAKTIHRQLGLNNNDDLSKEDAIELSGNLLVVDEMSMVDTALFSKLISAVQNGMQVVLVGDKDQLPSVGPGQVFHDLIASNVIPTVTLDQIHRQSEHSTITELAYEIQQGKLPEDFAQNQKDRSFFNANFYQIKAVLGQIISKALARGFSKNDVQVLAPMYKGAAGIDELNSYLQTIMNPIAKDQKIIQITSRNQNFRVGDKVLQLINVPENNVFNGDIGEIVGLVPENVKKQSPHIIVNFNGNEVTYSKNEWSQITLAYCISIHKSQGSEFKMVLLPIVHQYARMLERNLIYTAITRAKDILILLGEQAAFASGIEKVSSDRSTTLVRILTGEDPKTIQKESHEQSESTEKVLTNQMIEEELVDPMIGMNGIRPKNLV